MDSVIVTHIVCPNGHPIDTNRPTTANTLVVIFGRPGLGLQGCLDNVVFPLHYRCPTCCIHLLHKSTCHYCRLFNLTRSNKFDCWTLDPILRIACEGSQIQYNFMVTSESGASCISISNISLSTYRFCMVPRRNVHWAFLVYNSNNTMSIQVVTESAVGHLQMRVPHA